MRFLLALLSTALLLAGSVFAFPLMGSAPASAATAGTSTAGTSTANSVATTPSGGATDSHDQNSSGVSITLDEVTPWVDEKGTLKVRGLITNSTDQAISNPDLALIMSTNKLDSDRQIQDWTNDQSQHRTIADLNDNGPDARKKAKKAAKDSGGKTKPATSVDATFDKEITPGSSSEFTISVPAEKLGLQKSSPVSAWGPRGLSVQLGNASGLLASGVAFSTWYPSPKFDSTKISILAPVTLPGHTSDGLVGADELDKAIAEGGSLATISHVLDNSDVGIALDPRIIASFESAVAEPTSDTGGDSAKTEEPTPNATNSATPAPADDSEADGQGSADGQSAEEKKADEAQRKRLDDWYHDFLDKAKTHTVIVLPFADPDQASLTGGPLNDLGTFAQDQKKLVKEVLPKANTDIAWPLAGTVQRSQLDDFAKAGDKTVIVDDTQQPSLSGIRDSAHSKTRITADAKTSIETLTTDSALADQSAGVIASGHPAAKISELVASTAAIESQAPYRARHLLVPLPRTAASANWQATIDALSDAPWIEPAGIDELLDSDVVPRGLLQQTTDADQIGTSALQSLAQTRARQSRFNSVFTDPDGANTRMDRELLSCTSAAWTLGGSADRCAREARAASEKAMNSLYLEKGSSVLLVTGEKTTIPVTIVNDSSAESALKIRMKPQTPQLRAQTTDTVKVPPQETMRVDVPVEGLANADVPTTIEMVTADDVVLPKNESLLVRVRADWENIGTAVVGLALAAVFVIGLIKTISRGRRKIPEQQLADAMARAKNDEPEKR